MHFAHCTGWPLLFEPTGSTQWCVSTKRSRLRHCSNNFLPARFVCFSVGRALLSVSHSVKTNIKICPIKPHRYTSSPKQHASTLELDSVAAYTNSVSLTHTCTRTRTQTHMHRQIKSIATFLHIGKCCKVGVRTGVHPLAGYSVACMYELILSLSF